MKYCAIFHANLNYAYLVPEKYEFVIRNSYELIIDTMRDRFPEQKYVFEASGYTLDQIAEKCPDVLVMLKAAVDSGQCEFMGSPYAHLMMSNFPKEDDVWSLRFSQDSRPFWVVASVEADGTVTDAESVELVLRYLGGDRLVVEAEVAVAAERPPELRAILQFERPATPLWAEWVDSPGPQRRAARWEFAIDLLPGTYPLEILPAEGGSLVGLRLQRIHFAGDEDG